MSSCDLVQDIYYLSKGQVGQLILWPHNRDSELVFSMCGLCWETLMLIPACCYLSPPAKHQSMMKQRYNTSSSKYSIYMFIPLWAKYWESTYIRVFFFFLSFSFKVKQGLYNEHPYLKFMPTMMSLIFIPFSLKH